jgi:Tfp pilus assembly protein PilF
MSRSSGFHYKGRDIDPAGCGKRLESRCGDHGARVAARRSVDDQRELIDARNNRSLWGDRYDRKMADLIGVQKEISGAIATRLRERLSADAAKPVTKSGTSDPETYQLYLKGDYYYQKRTPESQEKAKDYFNEAIQKDPGYAMAWVGLAANYYVMPGYMPVSNEESMLKARAAAQKALALDETLAEAHAVLAGVEEALFERNGAEKDFRRAIELNSNEANTRNWYALFLAGEGRGDEAIAQEKQAVALEPLNLKYNDNLALVYHLAGENALGLEQFRKTIELDPSYASAYANVCTTNLAMLQHDLWLQNWKKAVTLTNDRDNLAVVEEAEGAYTKSGFPAAIRRTIEIQLQSAKRKYVDPAEIGFNYAAAGEKEQAFAWLDKASAEKSYCVNYLKLIRGPTLCAQTLGTLCY